MAHAGGRPTKYTDEMPQSLIDYFTVDPYTEKAIEHTDKKGNSWTTYEDVANDIPFFSNWCNSVDISQETMNQWKKSKPEFSEAYKKAKSLQKNFLIINGLRGLYNNTFAIFTAKNITDMEDKTEQKVVHDGKIGVETNDVTDRIDSLLTSLTPKIESED